MNEAQSAGRATERPRVGVVLTLLELYRRTDPKMPGEFGRGWTDVLNGLLSDLADLHFTEVAHTSGEVAAAVASCEEADCDLLLVLPMAYAASGNARGPLHATKLPLLLVSTARDATLPHDMSIDHLMANHAMHGIQDLANVLARAGRHFELIAGHHADATFREKLARAVHASQGARVLRQGRVGRIGPSFEGMLDFAFDPQALAESLGFEVVEMAPEELSRSAEQVSPERADKLADWARSQFDVDPALTADLLRTSAVWSLALEDLVESQALDAVAMNFLAVDAAGARTMPFLGASRLLSRGVGYAGESDVLTAALVTAVARIAGEATFTEMFCPDYGRAEVLLSHMGECNFALAAPDQPVKLISKDFAFGQAINPAVPVFQLRPGAVTLASLTEWRESRFRLVVTVGEVLAAPEHPNLSSPYSRIAFGRDLGGFLEDYSGAGGTHHLALAYGDRTDDLRTLARLTALDFVPV